MRSLTCFAVLCVPSIAVAQHARDSAPVARGMRIERVGHGFGQLLPHRIAVPDAGGFPTAEVVDIRGDAELAHVRQFNPVLPATELPGAALLPDALPGNHFFYVRFDQPLEVDSVLTAAASAAGQHQLTGLVQFVALDPFGEATLLAGRAFVGGRTYGAIDPSDPSQRVFETWVELDANGRPRARRIGAELPGLGFPGTQSPGAHPLLASLLREDTLVFVADSDDDLSTHETFPVGVQLVVGIEPGVRSRFGGRTELAGRAAATVGPDTLAPEILGSLSPAIEPPNGALDVDPATHIVLRFTEPLQPTSVGALELLSDPKFSPTVQLEFGPSAARVSVPFQVRYASVYDLTRVELVPAYAFPGGSGGGVPCGTFGQIEVALQPGLLDLAGVSSQRTLSSSFQTAAGPGLVNAPVAPDAIYVARLGGISVIDLNGFGASTGDPTYNFFQPILPGNSNYPNNPNVALQGSLLQPPLRPGTCTFDGGSAGVFTLTKDSNLGDVLVGAPTLQSVGDMALGHALDITFNNGAPFGCQSGGGNICAQTGLKRINLGFSGIHSLHPTTGLPVKIAIGVENPVSWAPSPNPPPLVFPPLCLAPLLLGQEPSSIVNTLPPPSGPGLTNLLVPGPNWQGNPALNLPPTHLLAAEQNAFFQGPSAPQPNIALCRLFGVRQKIGQFLYVVGRIAGELVVLDSNRFTVLDRIALADPTSLAMSPNLDLLAITQEGADQVTFLDVDPGSATFHEIVKTTAVGVGPLGIAWEPGNEDILVCTPGDGTVSVLSAFTLEVRKVLGGQRRNVRSSDGSAHAIRRPFEVAITHRLAGFGYRRNVYYAYLLGTDGRLSVFESGPDGVGGWGYDDIVTTLPSPFRNPQALQVDPRSLESAVYVLHEGPLDFDGVPTGQPGGALTRVGIRSGSSGVLPFGPRDHLAPPHLREIEFGVLAASLGEGLPGLSGIPVDIAFDDQLNLSALTNFTTVFSAGQPLSVNGKALVRFVTGNVWPANFPRFAFLAVPGELRIDVIDLVAGARFDANVFQPGVQSLEVTGVSGLMDYFRQ